MATVKALIDSRINFAQAVYGSTAPNDVINALCLMDVYYFSFDGRLHQGQLVINEWVRKDIDAVFSMIEKSRFPIAKVVPIVQYNWSDDASMADNNTSAFNYRFIAGTQNLSSHALGMAVDMNPRQNPLMYAEDDVAPPGAVYNCSTAGSLKESHPVVCEFLRRGWQWGGLFKDVKDYQHFEKKVPAL
ncbi:MAG: M15 family metallopeptidase [Deltaproteobacteria bacterium]|nr:M15 family metallopeptidase [Deltaproteobacteria bacterium]